MYVVGTPFPKAFTPVCKKILTRLYRVFVHVYIHHFDKLIKIGAVSFKWSCMILYITLSPLFQEAHVNACYKHFYYFVTEFSLVETKEFEPLVSVNLSICNTVHPQKV